MKFEIDTTDDIRKFVEAQIKDMSLFSECEKTLYRLGAEYAIMYLLTKIKL